MNNAILMASLPVLFTTYGPVVIGVILRVALVLIVFAIGRKVIGWALKIVDRALEHHGV